MRDLTDALRRAAAKPTQEPSMADLRRQLHDRQRHRRVAVRAMSGVAVVTAGALLIGGLRDDDRTVVTAAGDRGHATTVDAPSGRAHVGDGFCEPQLTDAGFRISPANPAVVPSLTEAAAIEQARVYVGNGSGTFSAYFAMVRNPVADKVLGTDVPRTMWVVQARDVAPSPRSTDPHLRPGAPNPFLSTRMVAFIDDATGTRVGAWGDCSDEPPVSVTPAANVVDIPNLLGRQVADATATLFQLGLEVAIEEQRTPNVPRGIVMAQTPLAGSRSAVGSQVTLQVSAGP